VGFVSCLKLRSCENKKNRKQVNFTGLQFLRPVYFTGLRVFIPVYFTGLQTGKFYWWQKESYELV